MRAVLWFEASYYASLRPGIPSEYPYGCRKVGLKPWRLSSCSLMKVRWRIEGSVIGFAEGVGYLSLTIHNLLRIP
jgi:hypothetical protein